MRATLLFDTYSKKSFGGSCGIVTYFFRKAFHKLGYETKDVYVPLTDKKGIIKLPKTKKDHSKEVRFFFEELFHRCATDDQFDDHPNISFFNLPFFSQIERHCHADSLLFNSKYLKECFLTEAYSKGLSPPMVDWIPLPLALSDFPQGYSSVGTRVSLRALHQLGKETYVGHALRPRKQDTFATLAIMHHLNDLAKNLSLKPFSLLISERDLDLYKITLDTMPIPKETMDYFYPMPHLNNKAVISVMKNSRFGLCYDTFWEAFGYYPIESVFCESPIFTNGAANLRHLLPPNHGIYKLETLSMHFGKINERIDAYIPVAKSIIKAMANQKKISSDCNRGKQYIKNQYSLQALLTRLQPHLQRLHKEFGTTRKPSKQPDKVIIKASPCLRLADWSKGLFVTDQGSFENPLLAKSYYMLNNKYATSTDIDITKFDKRILTIRKIS